MPSVRTISATGTINLHNAFPDDMVVSRFLVQIVSTGAGSYTLTPQKNVAPGPTSNASPGATGPTAPSPVNCWYYDALAGPTIVAAGTAVAADTILDIDSSGCEVTLNITVVSTKTLTLYVVPLLG